MNMIINRILIILVVAVASVPAKNIRRLPSAGIARSEDFNDIINRNKYIVPRVRMNSRNIFKLKSVGRQFGRSEDLTNEPSEKNEISKLLNQLVNHIKQVIYKEHIHSTVHSTLPFPDYVTRLVGPARRTDLEATDSSIPAQLIDEEPSSTELLSPSSLPPSIKSVECNSTAKHFLEIVELAQLMANSFQGSSEVLNFLVDVVREAIRGLEHFGGFENCQLKQNEDATNISEENNQVFAVSDESQNNSPSSSETQEEYDKPIEIQEISDSLVDIPGESDKSNERLPDSDELDETPEECDKPFETPENYDDKNVSLSSAGCKLAAEYFLKIIAIARQIIASTQGLNSLSEYAINIEKDAIEGLEHVKGPKVDQAPRKLPKLNYEAANFLKLFPGILSNDKKRIPEKSAAERIQGSFLERFTIPKGRSQNSGIWKVPQNSQAQGTKKIILIIPERQAGLQNHLTFNLAPSTTESATQTIKLIRNYNKDGGIVFGVPMDSIPHQDYVR